ncbi:hypothetical protein [Streptomyces sp. NPDC007074]|uniref:hypothetical protein n=1 Tax=Streptomyces sp. NPDC007074 TaxID=3156764 RepID=UPI0033C2B8C1
MVAGGGLSKPCCGKEPPLDGDAVGEAGGGPVVAVEQRLGLRGRTCVQCFGQQLLGEAALRASADPQGQRCVRGKSVRGSLGQECAGLIADR